MDCNNINEKSRATNVNEWVSNLFSRRRNGDGLLSESFYRKTLYLIVIKQREKGN